MPLYQWQSVENIEKLKLVQVFFSGDKAHVWDKRGVGRREIRWKTGLARLEPVQLQMSTLGANAERRSRVHGTKAENLIILLFNMLRRVRVNPNSHQNTEKQESDCAVYYRYNINVHRNNMGRNLKCLK